MHFLYCTFHPDLARLLVGWTLTPVAAAVRCDFSHLKLLCNIVQDILMALVIILVKDLLQMLVLKYLLES